MCKEAVAKYKRKWARKEKVLNEWECKVNECVQNRIASLKPKHINRRSHILRNRRHSWSLEELHSKYVLVPVDKAAQNVIVVCRKYYLEVVLKEIDSTATYERVEEDSEGIINRHIRFLDITVLRYHRSVNVCLHFIGFQSFINSLMELDS